MHRIRDRWNFALHVCVDRNWWKPGKWYGCELQHYIQHQGFENHLGNRNRRERCNIYSLCDCYDQPVGFRCDNYLSDKRDRQHCSNLHRNCNWWNLALHVRMDSDWR